MVSGSLKLIQQFYTGLGWIFPFNISSRVRTHFSEMIDDLKLSKCDSPLKESVFLLFFFSPNLRYLLLLCLLLLSLSLSGFFFFFFLSYLYLYLLSLLYVWLVRPTSEALIVQLSSHGKPQSTHCAGFLLFLLSCYCCSSLSKLRWVMHDFFFWHIINLSILLIMIITSLHSSADSIESFVVCLKIRCKKIISLRIGGKFW